MQRKLESRACLPCTEAKRKCNRHVPKYQRCSSRDVACRYPGPRVLYEVAYNKEGHPLTTRVSANRPTSSPHSTSPATEPMTVSGSWHARSNTKSDAALQSPWFLSLPSWSLKHSVVSDTGTATFDDGLRYIDKLRSWLLQWTTTGHCPLFHGLCRSAVMPPYVEEAYTMLVAYQNRTEKTTQAVLHIVERAVTRLLQKEQCDGIDDDSDMSGQQQAAAAAAHLERTQALLIYEIIRLFDGDIRARVQAEEGIHVLSMWTRQMWQSAASHAAASSTADNTPYSLQRRQQDMSATPVPPAFAPPLQSTFAAQKGDADSTWKAWIVAESIRRTYITSSFVEAVYTVLKQGWASCSAGIAYSGGSGLWDAASPSAWLNHIRGNDVFAIHCVELDRLFSAATPSDVDEFTQAMVAVSFGLDRYEAWEGGAT